MSASVPAWWSEVVSQWRGNLRLRLGLWLALGIVWVYALMWGSDQVGLLQARARQAEAELDRQRVIAGQSAWPERAEQARLQLELARALLWTEPARGLAEAALQDWINTLAVKVGLNVRERTLLRSEATDLRPAAATGDAPMVLPDGHVMLRMRLVFDFNPIPLVSFLSELAPAPRMVRVERLRLLPAGKPGTVEAEISALVRIVPRSTQ